MASSDQSESLFGSLPLLEWLPDETLFSLISRVHFLSGKQNARHTAKILFGNAKYGCHHDFPSYLNQLEHRTKGLLGTGQDIAKNKTLLKYYRAFIPDEQSTSIASTMCGESVANLKFQLGLLTSRFRANHPLKACLSCMREDYSTFGWSYWHVEHQYPGVWWCDNHHQPLYESIIKSTGVKRFSWYLPNKDELRQPNSINPCYPRETIQALVSLCDTAKSLVEIGNTKPWIMNDFWLTYRKELANRNWLAGQQLRYSEMVSDFLIYSNKLRGIPEFSALPTTISEAKSQLGRLFRQPRSGTHPLRHIIMIDWIFGGTTKFLETTTTPVNNNRNYTVSRSPSGTIDDSKKQMVILLIRDQNLSLREVSNRTDIDINIIMQWCSEEKIPFTRRPKVLKKEVRDKLIIQLKNGKDKSFLSKKYNISIATINRLLRTVNNLQTEWYSAQFQSNLNKARATWSSLNKKYSSLGTKLLRSLEPAVYAWLYRNDREWLRENTPTPASAQQHTIKHNIWNKRDIKLSTEVKRTALTISEQNPNSRIYLWQLYQQIPELKAKLDVLYKLPLTKRAIEQVIDSKKSKSTMNQELF